MPKSSISPTGASLTYYFATPILSIDTKQIPISQVIPGMSLMSYRPFSFDITFEVNTPTLGVLPTVTVGIEYAGNTYTIISAVLSALNLSMKRFKIKGTLTCNTDDGTGVWLEGEIRQNSGLVLGTGSTTSAFYNQFSNVNNTIDQNFNLTIQASSLLSGVTIILRKASVGML